MLRLQKFLHTNVQLSQLMFSLYVVIRAGSFLRHAVNMPSLCIFFDLYSTNRALSMVLFKITFIVEGPNLGKYQYQMAWQ